MWYIERLGAILLGIGIALSPIWIPMKMNLDEIRKGQRLGTSDCYLLPGTIETLVKGKIVSEKTMILYGISWRDKIFRYDNYPTGWVEVLP